MQVCSWKVCRPVQVKAEALDQKKKEAKSAQNKKKQQRSAAEPKAAKAEREMPAHTPAVAAEPGALRRLACSCIQLTRRGEPAGHRTGG